MRRGGRKAPLHRRRRNVHHLARWILYHQCSMCDNRRDHLLGIYPTGSDEAPGITVESVETGYGKYELA